MGKHFWEEECLVLTPPFYAIAKRKKSDTMEQLAAYFHKYENPPSKFTMMPLRIDLLP